MLTKKTEGLLLATVTSGSLALALSFLPASKLIGMWLGLQGARAVWAFPVLSALVWIVGKVTIRPVSHYQQIPWGFLCTTSILPLLVGLLYSTLLPGRSLVGGDFPREEILWTCIAIPLGEELLFRGWIYDVMEKLSQSRWWSLSFPLPASVVLTSIAFAFWHLQNWDTYPAGLVLFQVGYSFFAGLWLGTLRAKSGGIALGILAHAGLNLAALVF